MSQSSPEGIILGKGSQLISHKLTFSDEEPKPYTENPLILDEIGQFKSGTNKEMPWLSKEDWEKHHQLKQEALVYFQMGKRYIQQDGVVILAGKKETNGMVIIDPKNMFSVGHYSKCWNPKAFRLYEEPKLEIYKKQ